MIHGGGGFLWKKISVSSDRVGTNVDESFEKTGLETESFSHVVSNLVYHTVSDSEAALKGMSIRDQSSFFLNPSPLLNTFYIREPSNSDPRRHPRLHHLARPQRRRLPAHALRF